METYKYTLESAFNAQKQGSLFRWTQNFLRGEGKNKSLADHLVEGKPTIIELKEFPLSRLKRIMGPEEGMQFTESPDLWEERVNAFAKKIKTGVQLPPLIVTDFWKSLELSDGSHRHEALIRSGHDKYWTIFFFNKLESKKLLNEVK